MTDRPTDSSALRTDRRAGRARVFIALSVILLAWLAVWSSSFGGAFVFDDLSDIVLNESLHDVRTNEWLTHGRRPITNLTIALNWTLSGAETGPFHAVNILIHLAAALALFALVVVSMRSERISEKWRARSIEIGACVALLWLVHPLQTQSVTYIIQRGESLAGLWYVLTILCAAIGIQREDAKRGGSGGGSVWFILAVLACALAMGSKAVAVTAPIAVLLWDAVFGAGSVGKSLRARWPLFIALAMTWIIILRLGIAQQVLSSDTERTVGFGVSGVTWWGYLLTQTGVIFEYIRLSFWPDRLLIDHAWPFRTGIGGAIVPGMLLALAFIASAVGVLRAKWWGFTGMMFFLVLGPTSSVIPISDAAMEHRMYVPLAAIALFAVVGVFWVLDKLTKGHPGMIAVPALLAISLGLGVRTIERNKDYRDPAVLWLQVAEARPGNARGWNNYGQAILSRDPQAASDAFERAIEADPEFSLSRVNLGAALIELQDYAQAGEVLESLIAEQPDRADAITKLGIVQFFQGDVDGAVATLGLALEIEPNRVDAQANLAEFTKHIDKRDRAKALADDGKIRESAVLYNEYFSVVRNDLRAMLDYGEIAVNSGARSGVVEVLELALELDPDSTRGKILLTRARALAEGANVITTDLDQPVAGENSPQASQRWLRLGTEYRDQDKFDKAEEAFRTSIDYDPTNVSSRYNLALLLQKQEYYDEAVLEYLDMLVFAPSRVDARSNMGICYFNLGDTENAEKAFVDALEIDPDHFQSQLNLAVILDATREYDRAIIAYERALELSPGHSRAINRLGILRAIVSE